MATRAQLRARALFAKRAKAGTLRKGSKLKTKRRKVKKTLKRRSTLSRAMPRRRRRKQGRRMTVSRGIRRTRRGIGSIFKSGLVGKAVVGVGAATVTGLVMNRVAPQFTGIGSIGAGFLAGGPVGGIAALLLNGGLGALNLGFGSGNQGGQTV